jgi:hypothetical protein
MEYPIFINTKYMSRTNIKHYNDKYIIKDLNYQYTKGHEIIWSMLKTAVVEAHYIETHHVPICSGYNLNSIYSYLRRRTM